MTVPGPTSHAFVSQRLRLTYLDWGNPGAPLLLLVHGGRDHARSWDWLAERLRDRWHVVAPDLRGHGDSAWSPEGNYAAPFFVADLAQLVHQLAEGPVSILGHSLGGAIALRFAGVYPERVRCLAAIEGIGLPIEPREEDGDVAPRWRTFIEERRALSARNPRRYATLDEALARMRAENDFLSEAQARHLTVHGAQRNEDGSWSWKFDNYVRVQSPVDLTAAELRALWGRIACPVWLVHGADSWARHPAEEGRLACFADARATSFARAGHWVHHDRFDDFAAALDAFLADPAGDQAAML